jgi:hypothetical protein
MKRMAARSLVLAGNMAMARTATLSHPANHLASNPG